MWLCSAFNMALFVWAIQLSNNQRHGWDYLLVHPVTQRRNVWQTCPKHYCLVLAQKFCTVTSLIKDLYMSSYAKSMHEKPYSTLPCLTKSVSFSHRCHGCCCPLTIYISHMPSLSRPTYCHLTSASSSFLLWVTSTGSQAGRKTVKAKASIRPAADVVI